MAFETNIASSLTPQRPRSSSTGSINAHSAITDVLDYLQGAGFKSVKAYKDFAKNPATPEEFSIFVCQK